MGAVQLKQHYDVIVVGAGPAGASFIKTLQNHHCKLSVLLLDKCKFPRDKICGDALSHLCLSLLSEIFPETKDKIPTDSLTKKYKVLYQRHISLCQDNGMLDVVPRKVLDHLLWQSLDKEAVDVIEEAQVVDVLKNQGAVTGVQFKYQSFDYQATANLVIGADGSQSIIRRKTGPIKQDNLAAAVRQYVRNVSCPEDGVIFFPEPDRFGYFWIFPFLSRNGWRANVGYGGQKIDVKKRFSELYRHPRLQKYLKTAVPETPLAGFPVNLAVSQCNRIKFNRPLGGPGYILLGDAAGLVHPHTGEGISSALYSGKTCAELVLKGLPHEKLGKEYRKKICHFARRSFKLINTGALFKLPALLPPYLRGPYLETLSFWQRKGAY